MNLKTFFENFDEIAQAPGGVKRLRELILNLAVRGKLVEQDDGENPAKHLIKSVQEEKQLLIQSKKIKKSKATDPINLEESLYEIPSSWEWERFGNITICRDGERVPLSRDSRTLRKGQYDYYGASGVIDSIDDYLFDKPLLLIGEDGANLINRSTPIAFIAQGKYWVNNHAHVLDNISFDFLQYIEIFINAIDLKPYVTGTAQPKMNQAKMNSIPVPVPPLAEQKRIVAKVDELMALCDEIEAAQQSRDALQQKLRASALDALMNAPTDEALSSAWAFVSEHWDELCQRSEDVDGLRNIVMQSAIRGGLKTQEDSDKPASDLLVEISEHQHTLIEAGTVRKPKKNKAIEIDAMPFQLPSKWRWIYVQDAGEIKLGRQRSPKNHTGPHMVPYLRVANVLENELSLSDVKSMNFSPEEQETFKLKPDDILLNEGQSYELVGRPAIYNDEVPGACFQNTLLRFRGYSRLVPTYALLVFRAYMRNGRFRQEAQQTTNIAHLSAGRLSKIEFPLPPLAEQKRIVAKVEQLMTLCDNLQTHLQQRQQTAQALANCLTQLSL